MVTASYPNSSESGSIEDSSSGNGTEKNHLQKVETIPLEEGEGGGTKGALPSPDVNSGGGGGGGALSSVATGSDASAQGLPSFVGSNGEVSVLLSRGANAEPADAAVADGGGGSSPRPEQLKGEKVIDVSATTGEGGVGSEVDKEIGNNQSSSVPAPPELSELKIGTDEDDPVKLFVGGLAWETTEVSLHKVFEKYGTIVEVSIMRHPKTFCSRGFGFVTLSKREEAEAACSDKHTIDGRVVEAKISAAPGQNSPSGSSQAASSKRRPKVFVGGLSTETTDDDFRKYFEQFGEISESQILQDHYTGRSRGFGFITFTTEEAAEKVFAKGRFHELKGKLVEVKSATPRQQNKGVARGLRNNSKSHHHQNANNVNRGGVGGNLRRGVGGNFHFGVAPQNMGVGVGVGVTPQTAGMQVAYGMDPNTGYTTYPGYYPGAYNQVLPGPTYVFGGDAGATTVSPGGVSNLPAVPAVPAGYGQNAYSLGSFPVTQQGQHGGTMNPGFMVPPTPVYSTFVHPSTQNGNNQLNNVNPTQNHLMTMPPSAPPQNPLAVHEDLAVESVPPRESTGNPAQHHVLPATVPGNS